MKKGVYQVISLVLLLGLIPVSVTAAPPQRFVEVGDWSLEEDMGGTVGLPFNAYDVSWNISKPGVVELGFTYCDEEGFCQDIVEKEVVYNHKTDQYPQHLDLMTKIYHFPVDGPCTTTQFVRVMDKYGVVMAEAINGPYRYCLADLEE